MDERFAWRMFSDISLTERIVRYKAINRAGQYNGTEKIELERYFSNKWLVIIRGGDDGILNRVSEYLCKVTSSDFVEYEFRARFLDNSSLKKRKQTECS